MPTVQKDDSAAAPTTEEEQASNSDGGGDVDGSSPHPNNNDDDDDDHSLPVPDLPPIEEEDGKPKAKATADTSSKVGEGSSILTPHPHDVLSGRGGLSNHHPGNIRFRQLIDSHKRQYLDASRTKKPEIASSIVSLIKGLHPPGRFLKRNDVDLWVDIGEECACTKTKQALREGAPEFFEANVASGLAELTAKVTNNLGLRRKDGEAAAVAKEEEGSQDDVDASMKSLEATVAIAAAAGQLKDPDDEEEEEDVAMEDDDVMNNSNAALLSSCPPPLPPPTQWPPEPPTPTSTTTGSNNPYSKTYYAVRVGYAICPRCSKSYKNLKCDQHASKIRSAIFLHWEDVQAFVEFTTIPNNNKTGSKKPFYCNVEYRQFDQFEKAERYLRLRDVPSQSNDANQTKKSAEKKAANTKAGKTAVQLPLPDNKTPQQRAAWRKWEAMLQEAIQYKKTHGNLNVPTDENDPNYKQYEALSKWIKNQRSYYRYYLRDPMGVHIRVDITEEKVKLLKEVGFTWIYAEYAEYLAEQDPNRPDIQPKTGRPRKSAEQKMMEKEEKEAAAKETLEMYEKLKKYKEVHGTTEISESEQDEELVKLREWCKDNQDSLKDTYFVGQKGASNTSTGRKRKRDADAAATADDDNDAEPDDKKWNEMLSKLKKYKAKYGHCRVDKSHKPKLAQWVSAQRSMYQRLKNGKGVHSADNNKSIKLQKLSEIGFKFTKEELWEEQLNELREFHEKHGHCQVSKSHPTLGNFVISVRRHYKLWKEGKEPPGTMTAEREAALKEIGFFDYQQVISEDC